MHISTHPLTEVADYLKRQFDLRASQADKLGKLPAADIRDLKDTGYLALTAPTQYGGAQASMREVIAAHLKIAQGSASTAMVAAMTLHVIGDASEQRYWDESAFANLCRLVVEEGAVVNSVASEPALGSPSRGRIFQTTARLSQDGQSYIINGHKTWTTGGSHLTHMLVSLALGDDAVQILMPGNAPGINWQETWSDSLSLRASDSHDVTFEDVVVPCDNLLVKRGGSGANVWFPMLISAVYLGSALAARNAAIQFALDRVPTALGKPIATLPKIQRQIGEMDLALQGALALLLDVAGEWRGDNDARQRFMPRVAAAKTMVNQTANRVTDLALQIGGGQSITKDLPLERHFRDVRAGSMQPPSGDRALEMIGAAAIERQESGVAGD